MWLIVLQLRKTQERKFPTLSCRLRVDSAESGNACLCKFMAYCQSFMFGWMLKMGLKLIERMKEK